MSDSPQFLARRLQEEGEKTIQYFKQVNNDQWKQRIYTDGIDWNLQQLLAHFVTTEDGLLSLIVNIAGGGEGSPENFDIDRYNRRKVSAIDSLPVEELINLFSKNRSTTVTYVSGLSPEILSLEGRHPFLGIVPLVEIIKLVYRHNHIHLRDIRKVLSNLA
jgi:hypothetical protein